MKRYIHPSVASRTNIATQTIIYDDKTALFTAMTVTTYSLQQIQPKVYVLLPDTIAPYCSATVSSKCSYEIMLAYVNMRNVQQLSKQAMTAEASICIF
jgi:hypothetical protein